MEPLNVVLMQYLLLDVEAYGKFDLNLKDLFESVAYPGFQKMAIKHWKMGWEEMWRSYNKKAFVKALKRLIPEIKLDDLLSAPAGIRAQAVTSDGSLVDDFLIQESERIINVCNAPSPAATASLNIGSTIVEEISLSSLSLIHSIFSKLNL